jgi:hypothetical protein
VMDIDLDSRAAFSRAPKAKATAAAGATVEASSAQVDGASAGLVSEAASLAKPSLA